MLAFTGNFAIWLYIYIHTCIICDSSGTFVSKPLYKYLNIINLLNDPYMQPHAYGITYMVVLEIGVPPVHEVFVSTKPTIDYGVSYIKKPPHTSLHA